MTTQTPGLTTPRRSAVPARVRLACALAPLMLAAGCAAFPSLQTTNARPPAPAPTPAVNPDGSPTAQPFNGEIGRRTDVLPIPGPPPAPTVARQPATDAQIDALVGEEAVDATLAPQTIPQFVNAVFGGLLGVPFTMTPDVAQRTEIIAGGTGGTISKRTLMRLAQRALGQYGVPVYIEGGSVIVGGADATPGGADIVRGRNVPTATGRVVQFFTIQTIEVNALQALLADLYPNLGGVRITPDATTNSVIISGSGREVAAVVRALREIDQPRFSGASVLRVAPIYWTASNLTQALRDALTTEGFVVSTDAGLARSITILSFQAANQLLIFTSDERALERVRYWVDTLDQPSAVGDSATTFVYPVLNTDAASLGQLAMGQAPATAQAQPPVGVPGSAPGQASGNLMTGMTNNGGGTGGSLSGGRASASTPTSGQFLGGRLVTDPIGNRILFTGTARDYAQLRALLDTLDTPAPQVVIEVVIAEVTLTDSTVLGVQLFGTEQRGDGVLTGGTEGIEIGSGGALLTFIGPDFRARLNAQASNNRVNVLQRPRLVTRSGGTARFQVGTDVPIITSQRATDFSSGGSGTDVLQSVQYRQTGVILEIQPVVYGDRVDLVVSQEISSAGEPPAGTTISSPSILNRSITTQISVADGWTGVLGGLIGNNYNKTNSGVPFLKDIPLVGSAFQSNRVSGDRTELLIMITPTIIRGDEDMGDIADRYRADMNAAFRTGRGWSYTLTPFSLGPSIRGIGVDLPSAVPASERPPLIPRRRPAAAPAEAAPVEPEPEPVP